MLDKATSLAKIGAWEIDLINQEIHWSSMTRQIHGISDETYNPNFEEAMAFYKEGAYRDAIIARVTMAVENGKNGTSNRRSLPVRTRLNGFGR
ncbi:hypothetical protein LWM68_17890 [Niabella sp. W65]|nr:hypothetical protein [Niabella sp. W65]MCH7364453.1 hypothetical protein [Niabella sp. W65]ULT40317.1 hypothetical protein KRR40_36775 [Niabella sp. I65]